MKLQIGVKVILENSNGFILLLRRHEQFLMKPDTPESWDIPGGRIKQDENLIDALKRETKEETGIILSDTPRLLTAQDIFVPTKDLHVVRLTYVLKQDTTDIQLSDEHDMYKWASRDDLQTNSIEPYLQEALQQYTSLISR